MSVVRRFLVAPSLVRLIRKERGNARITEGYFAPQAGRTSFVRVDGQTCQLILVTAGADGVSSEERTDVPRAHGDALMDVCSGKAIYERTAVMIGGREVTIDRYVTPAALDLVSVTFEADTDASGFVPPLWFGREVSSESAYDRHAVALQGAPASGEIGLTNAALDAVIDMIEPRFGLGRYGGTSRAPEARATGDDGAVNALRRMAPPPPPPAPAAAPIEPPTAEVAPEAAVPASSPQPKASEPTAAVPAASTDARMDDVFESLSQALGAAIQPAPPAPAPEPPQDDPGAAFERWTVRPRRSNIQPT